MDNDKRKQQYLKNFERQNPVSELFSPNAKRIGNSIVGKLKKKSWHTMRRTQVFNMLITR